MTVRQRPVLLLLLAATAGSVDAWSYFVLAHVFVANMTGNTVLLGLALSGGKWPALGGPLMAIGSYGAGVFAGTLLLREVQHEQVWPRQLDRVLGLEAALLLAAGLAWLRFAPGAPPMRSTLVAVAALALGLQSAAMQALQIPGVVTTYITGTWTTLWSGLARFLSGKEHTWEERDQLRLQTGVLACYCASAACAGWAARAAPRTVGCVPAVCLSATLLLARLARRAPSNG